MSDCDGFFDIEGIPFEPAWEDRAVRAVLQADFYNPPYKKYLIQCWFDTTYGVWNNLHVDLTLARGKMTEYLRASGFTTYEQMIEPEK